MTDFYDALQDARAELAGEGVHLTTAEAVALSLGAQHGSDLYPYLRDRHPFGLPASPPCPSSPRAPVASPSAGGVMTPAVAAAPHPLRVAATTGPDLPEAA